VLDLWKTEGSTTNEFTVILDRTIFHPQGGGQPADEGTIKGESITFKVTGLKPKDDAILHIGTFDKVSIIYASYRKHRKEKHS